MNKFFIKLFLVICVGCALYCATAFASLHPLPEGVRPNISGSVGTGVQYKNKMEINLNTSDFLKNIFHSNSSIQLESGANSTTGKKSIIDFSWIILFLFSIIIVIFISVLFYVKKKYRL